MILTGSTGDHVSAARMLRLIKPSTIHLDARLRGPTLLVEDLMKLEEDDVLTFDYATERPIDLMLNGRMKFRGYPATTGRKKAFEVNERFISIEPLALAE